MFCERSAYYVLRTQYVDKLVTEELHMTSVTIETGETGGFRRKLGKIAPYIFLSITIFPILIGYAWVIIATFSYRTEGLIPKDADGNFGGFTLQNWSFLSDPDGMAGYV